MLLTTAVWLQMQFEMQVFGVQSVLLFGENSRVVRGLICTTK